MRNRPVVSLPVMLLVTASACGPSAPPSEPVTEPEPSSTAMTETVEDAVRVERLDPALDALVAPANRPYPAQGRLLWVSRGARLDPGWWISTLQRHSCQPDLQVDARR